MAADAAHNPADEAATPSAEPARSPFMLWPEVIEFSTLSKAVIQRRVKAGDFPAPVQLSPNRVAWFRDEVAAWKANLAAKRARVAEFA